MKTTFLTATFTLFIACISFAQPQKGTYVVGGSLGFSFNKAPSQVAKFHRTSFSIAPSIGKFISEKYQLNGGLGYGFHSQLNESAPDNYSRGTTNWFSANIGVTRYFPMFDKLYFTVGGTISPSYAVSVNESNFFGNESSTTTDNFGGRIGASAGFTYFINEKWMLYTSLGVLSYEMTYDTDLHVMGHSIYSDISANSFGIGVKYILGQKNK